jgi:multidrug resistance efflux pump
VIGPKVAGYIEEVLVSDNQKVKAGDVLIRLDARDYRANLAKAEGAVAAEGAAGQPRRHRTTAASGDRPGPRRHRCRRRRNRPFAG